MMVRRNRRKTLAEQIVEHRKLNNISIPNDKNKLFVSRKLRYYVDRWKRKINFTETKPLENNNSGNFIYKMISRINRNFESKDLSPSTKSPYFVNRSTLGNVHQDVLKRSEVHDTSFEIAAAGSSTSKNYELESKDAKNSFMKRIKSIFKGSRTPSFPNEGKPKKKVSWRDGWFDRNRSSSKQQSQPKSAPNLEEYSPDYVDLTYGTAPAIKTFSGKVNHVAEVHSPYSLKEIQSTSSGEHQKALLDETMGKRMNSMNNSLKQNSAIWSGSSEREAINKNTISAVETKLISNSEQDLQVKDEQETVLYGNSKRYGYESDSNTTRKIIYGNTERFTAEKKIANGFETHDPSPDNSWNDSNNYKSTFNVIDGHQNSPEMQQPKTQTVKENNSEIKSTMFESKNDEVAKSANETIQKKEDDIHGHENISNMESVKLSFEKSLENIVEKVMKKYQTEKEAQNSEESARNNQNRSRSVPTRRRIIVRPYRRPPSPCDNCKHLSGKLDKINTAYSNVELRNFVNWLTSGSEDFGQASELLFAKDTFE